MAANDALVQPTEQTKVEFGDAKFSGEDGVQVSPNAATTLFLDSDKLEHYRNEKKYRLIRWALFIAFWLIWIALIGSAIAIIVFSPRKKEEPSHTRSTTYEVFLPSLSDGPNGFERLKNQLDPLADLGINTLLISPVFKYNANDADHTDVEDYVLNDSLGTKEELKNLIKSVHDEKMKIIADVPLKLLSKKSKNLDGLFKRTKEGEILDLGNSKAREYLLNGITENLVNVDGVSFDGVYIHEPSDSDVNVDNYNKLLTEANNYTKNGKKVFSSDFVFIVAADYEKGQKINAHVIYNRLNVKSANDAIKELINAASKVVVGNTTFTPILSSADVPRFAANFKNNENLLKLVNGLRLFAFPHSHILYGEEYGQVCNGVPSLCKFPNLDYFSISHNATIPVFGDELRESAKYVAGIHPNLISNSSIVMENSITRDSIDGHHYSFVFNEKNTTKSITYKDVIPSQFTQNLKVVGVEGVEDDYSEKTDNFAPYEFKILKFLKVD